MFFKNFFFVFSLLFLQAAKPAGVSITLCENLNGRDSIILEPLNAEVVAKNVQIKLPIKNVEESVYLAAVLMEYNPSDERNLLKDIFGDDSVGKVLGYPPSCTADYKFIHVSVNILNHLLS